MSGLFKHDFCGQLRGSLGRPRASCVLALAAGCFALAVIYAFPPEVTRWYPKCPFHYLTGLNCPGCGSLRALHALTHGRVVEALGCNPFLVVCLPLVAAGAVVRFLSGLVRNRSVELRLPEKLSLGLVVGVIVFFVARNVPAYPFTLLSP